MAIVTGTLLALKGAGALMAKKTAAVSAKAAVKGSLKAKAKDFVKGKVKGKLKSIAKDKLLGGGGGEGSGGALVKRVSIGGALVKTETTDTVKQEANIAAAGSSGGSPLLNEVIEIKITTIQIKDLLASNLAQQKAADAAARKQAEKDRKAEKEAQLESGAGSGGGGMKMPKGPKVGPFEAIKRFLLMTFLGTLLAFLLKHHKKVLAVFNFLTKNITATIKIYLALRKLFRLAVQKLLKSVLGLSKKLFTSSLNLIGKAIKKTGSLVFDTLKNAANLLFDFLSKTINLALDFAKNVAQSVSQLGKQLVQRANQIRQFVQRASKAAYDAVKSGKGFKGAVDAVKKTSQEMAEEAAERAVQEAAEKAAQEGIEKVTQEGIEKVAQEGAEKVAQEAAEKVAQEAAEKVAQETAEKVAQEAAEKVGQEVAEKVVQEGAEQVAKKAGQSFLSRIPFLGGLITAIISLASGEPVTQAIFKASGAVLGGFLGSFIPIPVIGTLIGELLGEYVGDLFYTGLMGGGMDAVGKKLQEDITSLLKAGKFVADWIGDGFSRLNEGVPTLPLTNIKNYLVLFNPIESVPLFYKAFFTRDAMTKKEEKEPEVEQKFLGGIVNAAKDFLGMGSTEGDGMSMGSISASGNVKEPKKLPGLSLTKIPLKNQETYIGVRFKNNALSKGLGSIFGGILGDGTDANDGGGVYDGPSSYSPASYRDDPDFEKEVNRIAQKFDIDASDLLGKIASESGFNPAADNGTHVGLIQFSKDSARAVGTTQAALKRMTRAQQMKYVEKYFDYWNLPKGSSAGHLYTVTYLPAFASKPANYVLAKRGGFTDSWGHHPASWYSHNAGLDMNNDGKITIAELGERIQKKKREFGITGGGKSPRIAKEPVTEPEVVEEQNKSNTPNRPTPDNPSSNNDSPDSSEDKTENKAEIKKVYNPDGTLNFGKTFIHKDLLSGGTFGAGLSRKAPKSEDDRGEGAGEIISKPGPSMMRVGSSPKVAKSPDITSGSSSKVARSFNIAPGLNSKVVKSPNIAPVQKVSFGSVNIKNYQIEESAHYDEPSAQIIMMPPPQQPPQPQRKPLLKTGKRYSVMPLFPLNKSTEHYLTQVALF